MAKFLSVFKKVLGSYSLEEKIISLILMIMVVIVGGQGIAQLLKDPTLFKKNVYIEGFVSEDQILLNPLDFSEASKDMSSLIFSGLIKYNPKTKSFVDDLAQFTLDENKKVYRFTLKEKIFWHDGEPVTADDVYYTYHDVIQNPAFQSQILKPNFEGIEIKKIDQRTIEFILQEKNSFFITNFNIGILPKHILGKIPVTELASHAFNLNPTGTGPYKVNAPLETLPDGHQRLVLTAFDQYYGKKPKIEEIRFYIYPAMEMLLKEKNIINVISHVSKDLFLQLKDDKRFTFQTYELPQYTAIFMNMNSALLKGEENRRVRIALQKAIDKNALLKLFSYKTAIDTPLLELNQSEWIYQPNAEEANGALFEWGKTKGYSLDKNPKSPYRKDASGKILKLVLLTRIYDEGTILAEENAKLLNFLKEAWKKIGIQIEVQAEPTEAYQERIMKHDYDLLLAGQSLGYNLDTYSYWHPTQAKGGLNFSNYNSFAASSLIVEIRQTFDQAKKEKLLTELAKNIAKDVPAIFLYRPQYLSASDGKVKNINFSNLAFSSDRFANIDEWCTDCK